MSRPLPLPSPEEVLPHRPPMCLLDGILRSEAHRVICHLTLHEESMFVEHGRARAVVALELMAQAAAVQVGLRARAQGESMARGMLLSVPDLTLSTEWLHAGDALEIEAECEWERGADASFRCATLRDGVTIATAHMTLRCATHAEGRSL